MAARITVLVVDDDEDSRTLLELALSTHDLVVVCAANGAEALTVARERTPQVILLDLAMPIMDGFAFRAAQMQDPQLAAIPVICVSGRHDSQQAARELHLDACVSKPFELDEIIANVKTLAARRRGGYRGSGSGAPRNLAAL
jgi:CheY-like chemotaxis protein